MNNKDIEITKKDEFSNILKQIQISKQKAYAHVNTILVKLYWNIGKHIFIKVKEKRCAKSLVKELADFIKEKESNIKGFTDRNMWMMKQFYETYSDNPKLHSLCAVLSWSHNRKIISPKILEEKEFYLQLCSKKNYSVRELERLIQSGTYERVMLSNKKLQPVVREMN